MDTTVAKIKKNKTAELWISVRNYRGREYVDVREHFLSSDDHAWHPTKKGLMVLPELVPLIADGVLALDDTTQVSTVARIGKSARDEVQIGVREYQGTRYGEIRMWYLADSSERKPSPKGVTFKLEMVEDLVAALRDACALTGKR